MNPKLSTLQNSKGNKVLVLSILPFLGTPKSGSVFMHKIGNCFEQLKTITIRTCHLEFSFKLFQKKLKKKRTFWKLLICIYLFVNKVGLNIFLVLLLVVRCVKNQMIQFASFGAKYLVFFSLVPSKREKNILVLLTLYIIWGKCLYFSILNDKIHNYVFFNNCEFHYSKIQK